MNKYSLSGASWSVSTSFIRRTARSAPAVTATAWSSATAVSVVVIVSWITRWATLFWLHLTGSCRNNNKLHLTSNLQTHTSVYMMRKSRHTLSVSLSKLNLDLPSTDPLSVQVMQGVFCVSHILKPARLLRLCFLKRHWLLEKYKNQKKHHTQTFINDLKRKHWGLLWWSARGEITFDEITLKWWNSFERKKRKINHKSKRKTSIGLSRTGAYRSHGLKNGLWLRQEIMWSCNGRIQR